jgi:hypothetical protein
MRGGNFDKDKLISAFLLILISRAYSVLSIISWYSGALTLQGMMPALKGATFMTSGI